MKGLIALHARAVDLEGAWGRAHGTWRPFFRAMFELTGAFLEKARADEGVHGVALERGETQRPAEQDHPSLGEDLHGVEHRVVVFLFLYDPSLWFFSDGRTTTNERRRRRSPLLPLSVNLSR